MLMRRRALRAVGDDEAVLQLDHAARAAREAGIVRHDEQRLALARESLEEQADVGGGLAVEVAGGLVGDEDRRIVGERARDGRALLLAARKHRRAACAPGPRVRRARAAPARARGARPA